MAVIDGFDDSDFNPRAPCGARLRLPNEDVCHYKFQPTRPLRGATRRAEADRPAISISTHAPLAGRDRPDFSATESRNNFNPRAPCGARLQISSYAHPLHKFQPTRPLRGATAKSSALGSSSCHFNPRAPCGARPSCRPLPSARGRDFNPRAPCGARRWTLPRPAPPSAFQPTRPLRGATGSRPCRARPAAADFNPRAPCGARPAEAAAALAIFHFNPRAPCGARLPGVRKFGRCP